MLQFQREALASFVMLTLWPVNIHRIIGRPVFKYWQISIDLWRKSFPVPFSEGLVGQESNRAWTWKYIPSDMYHDEFAQSEKFLHYPHEETLHP